MSAHCSECGDDLAWDLTCGRCEMTADRDRWKSLALDMGELLRGRLYHGFVPGSNGDTDAYALLARLDQLGKEQMPEHFLDDGLGDDMRYGHPQSVPARRPEDDALDRLDIAKTWIPGQYRVQADADLATVREALERQRGWEAIARERLQQIELLTAEVERQREERDDAKERIQVWVRHDLSQQGQLRAAEAEADKYRKATDQQARRAEAAEAENRRLTEGLREADEAVSAAHHVLWASYDEWEGEHGRREPLNAFMWRLHEILRSLLSASPSDGGGA